MQMINVINIKCGGCEAGIRSVLEKEGFTNVIVSVQNQTVSFENGDMEKAKQILSKMGYPQVSSKEAKSLTKKAKSYLSCVIGKMKR
ncbi:MAG: hypothetical protein UR69_C0003G0115 [Candidatus Moranbacteria bacterium GW2011_GWE2_35_2-]|nr:MAG: hypothetical protein UR69_C0003G0115 [Candidatus Moranbacteria bacterium GW2011_GWE2_35_2-]KKQ21992.1 MAG: hypothetical protein US37_C0005G0034 [Candidatus Moranbacteria bacterium GW2011_GWF2_37_11]KKQ29114.1 MAG: hypothetical protein US44_C0003G0026 [Candidatus Moranbacteria bacterium GW2011_GWD1_37_17]KKQ31099.1 MAG: hypothetical protein US47_C0001G0332 [Candidatus Moranbacteria bacterium GW2011_GWE1_37_24]KKQ46896.1 MAG: hypothetical protein US66_C0025G0019 [Candidatus Moranbacteria 